jgi:LacI family transcriptional regulator
MITIKEIAKQLNMSTTTVSNVIHGKTGEVSAETIERVEKFLDEVDYVPNINARNLAQNQSKIIGVVLKTSESRYSNILTDPFVAEMLGGIEKVIRESGYFMMVYISEDINEILKRVTSWNVDGLLLFWMLDDDARMVYSKFRGPVCFIDTFVDWDAIDAIGSKYVNVGLDDEKATYEAISYLISCGHKKIGFLSDRNTGVDSERFKGYRRALKEAGLKYEDEDFFEIDTTMDGIDDSIFGLTDKAKRFDAVFCVSDNFAAMLINACFRSGIDVPGDVSVMGFDDNMNGRLFRPSLTTVHQDIAHKGEVAAQKLIEMVHGEEPAEHHIRLETKIVKRESVADMNKK